jgi:uncharacterized repeat protein (TIGR01451 family)
MLTRGGLAIFAVSALCVVLSVGTSSAQTFNGSTLNTAANSLIPSTGTGVYGGAPDHGGTIFNNAVAGVAAGTPVLIVQINLTHTFVSDLDIYLRAPNGQILELTSDNGGGGDNYTNTTFQDGVASITTGTPPFTGAFAPEGTMTISTCGTSLTPTVASLGAFITGQNGIWELVIKDDTGADVGTMVGWSITFGVPPDLSIIKTHVGNFNQGETGTYTITVSNSAVVPTAGTVTVTDVLPAGMTAIGISGTGWNCTQPGGPCTRTDVLAPSASYPPLTLTVSVGAVESLAVVNVATVSGGGDISPGNNTAADPTRIIQPAPVPVMSRWSLLAAVLMLLALARYRSIVR